MKHFLEEIVKYQISCIRSYLELWIGHAFSLSILLKMFIVYKMDLKLESTNWNWIYVVHVIVYVNYRVALVCIRRICRVVVDQASMILFLNNFLSTHNIFSSGILIWNILLSYKYLYYIWLTSKLPDWT